jgi:hypothetical protein
MSDPFKNKRSNWMVTLNNEGSQIRIFKRDGSDFTEDDRETVILVLMHHFHSESSFKAGRSLDRPEAGTDVATRTGVEHTLDPIVSFFAAYRKRRRMALISVARLMGEGKGTRVGAVEAGKTRPLIEFLRDWGYALGFNLMPIPLGMVSKVRDMVNEYLADQYARDIARWSREEGGLIEGGARADLPPGPGLLGDGEDSGPAAAG